MHPLRLAIFAVLFFEWLLGFGTGTTTRTGVSPPAGL